MNPRNTRDKKCNKHIAPRTATYVILLAASCFAMFPILWAISTSLKPESEVLMYPPSFIPLTFTWENYNKVLFQSNYPIYFANTILVTAVTMAVSVLVASHGAYAFEIGRAHV